MMESVASKPAPPESRSEQIRQRLGAIRTRIDELAAKRHQDDASLTTIDGRLAVAQREMAVSRAAAEQAIAASVRAFRRAAEAHERAALQHERAAAGGFGDKDQHERQAARHRAAATADTRRAEQAQSLVPDEAADDACGPYADQALDRLINLAARRTSDLPPPEPPAFQQVSRQMSKWRPPV
jgi:chromosome segregation ATPase